MTLTQLDLSALLDALPQDAVITDPDRMANYLLDRANAPDGGTPAAVVRATCTEDVQSAVRFAVANGLKVVTRGAGSGLSGGATALEGCLMVSTERMREIDIDPRTRTVRVQPGLMNAEVKAEVAKEGLWYPPDPSSYEICSIGGNVATNAGGLCCVKYGVTTDYVLGLTVVLADGTAVTLGGPRIKDKAGLPLVKLFVGSEGTLGIVTEAVLKLLPAQRTPCTMVATFGKLDHATDAVAEIQRGLRPSMLEFMDKACINAVEDLTKMGLDRDAEALLVIQSDESTAAAVEELATIEAICEKHHATEVFTTQDPDEGEAFVTARRMAIPAVEAKGSLLLEDVGVPLPQLSALVDGIAAIAANRRVEIAVVAHAGDGNTHPLIVFDPSDADHAARAEQAYGEVMSLAIELGGTITGEHGVGRLKKPWLGAQLGDDAMALNQRIKDALDPTGIFNPGTMFDG